MVDAASVHTAGERLAGQVVQAPLIGAPILPGRRVPAGLHVLVESLQPGGSWFRGACHGIARTMGRPAGLLAAGPPGRLRALAVAAAVHRMPLHTLWSEAPAPEVGAFLAAMGARVEVVAGHPHEVVADRARTGGWAVAPGPGDADWDLGMATLGPVLAERLPMDTSRVVVPAGAAAAVAAGLDAVGRPLEVIEAPARADPGLGEAVRCGLRVVLDDEGLGVLRAALEAAEGADVVAVV